MIKLKKYSAQKSSESLSSIIVKKFKETINSPEYGFFHTDFKSHLHQCEKVKDQINRKINTFVHIGLGGSSLGPEAMIKALKKNDTEFIFFNNVDAFEVHEKLKKVNLSDTLFYIVSKSGTTAETMALFSVVTQLLIKNGVEEKNFKDYIVFSTDPEKGDLRSYSQEVGIHSLDIPPNIGGRFSVFTSVGFFPALYADIDVIKLINGILDFKNEIQKNDFQNEWTFITEDILNWYQNYHIDQTVMMPYSFQLRDVSLWFVQLWAESLGKDGKGLTPLYAYGATDQHSQVQLFMEGPKNKAVFFLEVLNLAEDFELTSNIKLASLKKMEKLKMSTLMKAELRGTELALEEQERPYFTISLPEISPAYFGQILYYFQCLTVLVGIGMEINPFNQPGVEAGKKFAWEWIKNNQKQ